MNAILESQTEVPPLPDDQNEARRAVADALGQILDAGTPHRPLSPVFGQPYTREVEIDDRGVSAESGTIDENTADEVLTVFAPSGKKTGETGETGELRVFSCVTNAEFISEVFREVPDGAYPAVCSMMADPKNKKTANWIAKRADAAKELIRLPDRNNYLGVASFYPGEDGSFRAKKEGFAACHFLMLDDLGTKASFERLGGVELSWLIETSKDNYQGGIIFDEPITDRNLTTRILNAVIEAGLCDAGSNQALSKWARLPIAINGKPERAQEDGTPFQCRLVEWRPERRYAPQDIVDRLQLVLSPAGRPKKAQRKKPDAQAHAEALSLTESGYEADEVLRPRAAENPVISALKLRDLYKTPLGGGKHDITCPWVHEHADEIDDRAAYWEPDEFYAHGGFCCQHKMHLGSKKLRQLIEYLDVQLSDARHKPTIKLFAGELHGVIDAAEKELAARGRHYQSGGLIVSVTTDPVTGDPSICPTSAPALTRELSIAATWERFEGRSGMWTRTDPPARHVAILYDAQSFRHLPPLAGVARQPYFRESDGVLIAQPGYDKTAQRFGVFDARQFVIPDPTPEAARAALALLEDLLTEFHFVDATDKAAALAAIFTAVVRPSLPQAPGFHARAPTFGSGKTYLCELIGAFAGPGGNAKVSYPTTPEEATKTILSLLLTSPAVIEFDDMDTDWLPHGTIKRMLTAEQITDRILGVSKTATVSTRTLFLGSGNNCGPIRDLLRRVLTIHIDPRCQTPATLAYDGAPVDKVRKNRGKYVSAVLAIILAWRNAGMPRATVENIVTFGGAWADYCRHPLMWLGHPDPATALLTQVKHDPDGDALAGLMTEWLAAFGSVPTTVRRAVDQAFHLYPDLLDAMREFPVEKEGGINRHKMGWILSKNAGRIVAGYEFKEGTADGRKAWQVVSTKTPLSPVSPVYSPSVAKTVRASSTVVEVEV